MCTLGVLWQALCRHSRLVTACTLGVLAAVGALETNGGEHEEVDLDGVFFGVFLGRWAEASILVIAGTLGVLSQAL